MLLHISTIHVVFGILLLCQVSLEMRACLIILIWSESRFITRHRGDSNLVNLTLLKVKAMYLHTITELEVGSRISVPVLCYGRKVAPSNQIEMRGRLTHLPSLVREVDVLQILDWLDFDDRFRLLWWKLVRLGQPLSLSCYLPSFLLTFWSCIHLVSREVTIRCRSTIRCIDCICSSLLSLLTFLLIPIGMGVNHLDSQILHLGLKVQILNILIITETLLQCGACLESLLAFLVILEVEPYPWSIWLLVLLTAIGLIWYEWLWSVSVSSRAIGLLRRSLNTTWRLM